MALGPIYKGQTRPSWVFTVHKSDGTALDITGATFTGTIRDRRSGTTVTLTVGSFSITTAASGIFTYAPVAADVAAVGSFIVEAVITISGGVFKVQADLLIKPSMA